MSVMEHSTITLQTLKQMLAQGKRFDGRNLLDHRQIHIEYNVSNKAEGSARVTMGKTQVIVGVKLAPNTPYPDSLDKGNLMVSGDLLPLASPRFESGPPGFDAIELPRLVDRAIRESGMIDLKKLVIKEGELVWTVFIDIYPINDDGNLIDAATIAAISALKHAVVPILDENNRVDYDKKSKEQLPVSKETAPFSISFFKIGDSIIVDPTREEEEAADSRVTWGISRWNGQYMINSCQKSRKTTISRADIETMSSLLPKKYDELSEKLKKFF